MEVGFEDVLCQVDQRLTCRYGSMFELNRKPQPISSRCPSAYEGALPRLLFSQQAKAYDLQTTKAVRLCDCKWTIHVLFANTRAANGPQHDQMHKAMFWLQYHRL